MQIRVPVSWIVMAYTVVEAESVEEAIDLATGVDLDCFDGQEYLPDSFDVDEEGCEILNSPRPSVV
jgi:hypothetical protein